jgi:hypothetical protein
MIIFFLYGKGNFGERPGGGGGGVKGLFYKGKKGVLCFNNQ